jgi:hypothetical protein
MGLEDARHLILMIKPLKPAIPEVYDIVRPTTS